MFPSLFFFFDAHKPPIFYGTHVARWFGARNVLFFVVAARLFLVFASFLLLCCWSTHKSLAPRTRTLLGVLWQATLNFVAVATLLFFLCCVCPKFCDLAKQRRKTFVVVSEVGKIDFALYFFWLCVFFLVFHFLLLRSRDTSPVEGKIFDTRQRIFVPEVYRRLQEYSEFYLDVEGTDIQSAFVGSNSTEILDRGRVSSVSHNNYNELEKLLFKHKSFYLKPYELDYSQTEAKKSPPTATPWAKQ